MTSNTIKIKSVRIKDANCGFCEAIATSIDDIKYQYACKIHATEAAAFRERVITTGEISSLTWFPM
jgi:hypothetical protein